MLMAAPAHARVIATSSTYGIALHSVWHVRADPRGPAGSEQARRLGGSLGFVGD